MLQYFKTNIKKVILLSCFFISLPFIAGAQDNLSASLQEDYKLNAYFFYGEECPHCADEDIFLKKLEKEYDYLQIKSFEVWHNRENAELINKIIQELDIKGQVSGVPVLFISGNVVNGFINEETTGTRIRQLVEYHYAAKTPDIISPIINSSQNQGDGDKTARSIADNQQLEKIKLPFFGEMNLRGASLLGLSLAIGFIDGFNPCAMWVLLFLISMLLGMQNKKRMWAIGMIFIISSGLVYFLFMAAWLNLFLFIGFIFWIRVAIGATAIASGVYHLREFYKNRNGACKVIEGEKRTKIFNKIKNIIQAKSFSLAVVGIIGLAAMINMVELVCSAGLPAIYTSVLSAANLPVWKYYGYMLVYIFMYIIDDLAIFIAAMLTLQVTGISKRYVRAANLIGGIIILLIGILLIFKPEWIML
ncbi:MAG: hypothetical protein WC323_01100 [Patescibacteria group bacterium]|jgi:glutaredoxin